MSSVKLTRLELFHKLKEEFNLRINLLTLDVPNNVEWLEDNTVQYIDERGNLCILDPVTRLLTIKRKS